MAEEKYVPRLKTKYNNEVKQQLQDKFQYENVMMIPKFEKIVVNMGVGAAASRQREPLCQRLARGQRGARCHECAGFYGLAVHLCHDGSRGPGRVGGACGTCLAC